MKGFKDSTKTQYAMGGSCYAKGGSVKGAAKISKVMGEFKSGTLHSGSKKGPEVTNPKQATAIALSEARKAGAKIPVKKAGGGSMDKNMVESTSSRPTRGGRPMTLDEMQLQATPAELAAVARGNRIAREEASESRLVRNTQKATPRTREVVNEQRMNAKRIGPVTEGERARMMTEGERARMMKAKPSYRDTPLIGGALGAMRDAVRDVTGLKKGGLAVMPRGKGKC